MKNKLFHVKLMPLKDRHLIKDQWETSDRSLFFSALMILMLIGTVQPAASQSDESRGSAINISGNIGITNEGISIVPALSLGEPAILTNISIGNRFRFEPDFNFTIEGDPWQFLLWLRYNMIERDRFSFRAGIHPGYSFRKVQGIGPDTEEKETTEVLKFLAGDLSTSYSLSETVDVGAYYLLGFGVETAKPDQIQYVNLNAAIRQIQLNRQLFLNISPQVYYLKVDELDGFYVASNITLGVRGFPVTLSSMFNKIIDSDITGADDPLWNISLNYSFRF
jgi:hypothetical protein